MVTTSKRKVIQIGLLAFFIGSSTVAQAQVSEGDAAATMKSACRTDYRAHCIGSDPAPPIAAACLAQFYVNLSKNCQAALDAYNTSSNPAPDP